LARPTVLLTLLLAFLGPFPSPVAAQDQAPLRFSVAPETGRATVEVGDLLDDHRLLEAVHSGLPLRIRVVIQLWKDGFFDSQKGQYEWRASLIFDPLTRRYRITTRGDGGVEREVNTLPEVRAALEGTLDPPLEPPERGSYYYLAGVAIETLSLSDLEELELWLKGELAPAVAGERDVEGALAKGFRRLLVQLLGLPARRFQVRSPSFRFEPGG